MRNRHSAVETPNDVFVEYVGHQAQASMTDEPAVMRRGDPRALLSAMLQRVQTEIGEVCSLRSIEDTDYAAFFMKLVDSESPGLC